MSSSTFNLETFYKTFSNFNWKLYLAIHPDFNELSCEQDAINQFLKSGKNENRIYSLNIFNEKFKSFDWKAYAKYKNIPITNELDIILQFCYNEVNKNCKHKFRSHDEKVIPCNNTNNTNNHTHDENKNKFNWKIYVASDSEIEKICKDEASAHSHYLKYGQNKIYNSFTFYKKYSSVNWNSYVKSNKNLEIESIIYYCIHGNNKIKHNPVKYDSKTVNIQDFNWKIYLAAHEDLFILFKTEQQAIRHFSRYGKNEHRIYNTQTFYNQFNSLNWNDYVKINKELEEIAIIHYLINVIKNQPNVDNNVVNDLEQLRQDEIKEELEEERNSEIKKKKKKEEIKQKEKEISKEIIREINNIDQKIKYNLTEHENNSDVCSSVAKSIIFDKNKIIKQLEQIKDLERSLHSDKNDKFTSDNIKNRCELEKNLKDEKELRNKINTIASIKTNNRCNNNEQIEELENNLHIYDLKDIKTKYDDKCILLQSADLEILSKEKELNSLKERLEKLEMANYYFMSGINYQVNKKENSIFDYAETKNIEKKIKKNIFIKNKKTPAKNNLDDFALNDNCYVEIPDNNTLERLYNISTINSSFNNKNIADNGHKISNEIFKNSSNKSNIKNDTLERLYNIPTNKSDIDDKNSTENFESLDNISINSSNTNTDTDTNTNTDTNTDTNTNNDIDTNTNNVNDTNNDDTDNDVIEQLYNMTTNNSLFEKKKDIDNNISKNSHDVLINKINSKRNIIEQMNTTDQLNNMTTISNEKSSTIKSNEYIQHKEISQSELEREIDEVMLLHSKLNKNESKKNDINEQNVEIINSTNDELTNTNTDNTIQSIDDYKIKINVN